MEIFGWITALVIVGAAALYGWKKFNDWKVK